MTRDEPRWDQRACRTQPELWNAPSGHGKVSKVELARLDVAAATCRNDCPVYEACRRLDVRGASGVIAGVLHREPTANHGPGRPLQLCGSIAAYQRHRRAGEQPCPACLEAQTDYNRQRRAAS